MNYSTNYSMREPVPGEKVKVADINYNTEIIDGVMLDNRQISIDMYDDTSTYNTDDLAGHENSQNRIAVYRCLEDNVTGTWDSTKWVQTNLADEITGLRGGGGSGNVTNTATGNPVEFTDGADAPFVGLTSTIQGSQSGSGTPSPENARPFTVYTQASATVADDDTDPTKTTTYTVSFSSYNPVYKGSVNYVNKSGIIEMWAVSLGSGSWTKYTESGGTFFSSYFPKDMRLSTEEYLCSHYAPKSGETLGDCEIEIKIRTGESYDLVIIRDDSKSDMSYSQFETWLSTNGVRLVYTLSTPYSLDFTLDTVRALKGSNYITSTTGDLTVEYITEGYQPLVNPDDFVGATSSANGEHGLVPAPKIADKDKYLKGDGTWGTITPGATTFAGLTDTDITNPTDGQAALYDETSGKWHNSDLPDADVTKTASGNPIEFSDAASAPLVRCETEIQGSQDLHGYDKPWVGGSGKNKCDPNSVVADTYISNTATVGQAVVYNQSSATKTYKVNNIVAGNTYTISYSKSSYSSANNRYGVIVDSNEIVLKNGIETWNYNTDSMTFTASDSGTLIFSIDNQSSDIQVEVGSQKTAFEPYENICPITAYMEGKIEVRGKNLLDTSTTDKNTVGITFTRNADGSITVNGTATSDALCFFFGSVSGYGVTPENAGLKQNVSYILNGCPNGGGVNKYFLYIQNTNNFSIVERVTDSSDSNVFTLSNKTYRCGIAIRSGVTVTNLTFYPMIRLAQDADSNFEPYTSTTHTTTYPSAIYRGSEDVVNGEVTSNMTTLDLGSLTWGRWGANVFYNTTIPTTNLDTSVGNDICSAYKCYKYSDLSSVSYGFAHYVAGGVSYLLFKDTRFDDATDFKSAVSGVTLAYELATPTTTTVTPTNLPIKSLSGYNHIESSTGEMEIEYITQAQQPLIDLIPEESGGGGTSYDTTEQVIGTWVDGRDVYRKLVIVQATWQNLSNGTSKSFAYLQDWVKEIDYVTNAVAVGSEQYYANMMPIAVQTDKGSGTATAYCNNPFAGSFTSMYVDYVILEYVKIAPSRSLAKSAPQEETKEEQVEELKEEPTEEVKEEPEEEVEEVKEEVKEEETKEEGEVNER